MLATSTIDCSVFDKQHIPTYSTFQFKIQFSFIQLVAEQSQSILHA